MSIPGLRGILISTLPRGFSAFSAMGDGAYFTL